MSAGAAGVRLGLDIGGTHCRAALVDARGVIVGQVRRRATPASAAGLARRVRELRDECVAASGLTPTVVGVGLPGWRDRSTGVMRRAVNLPFLEGLDVRRFLEQALDAAVRIETDANAAGWAQFAAGRRPASSRSDQTYAYLSIGTGIGACAIVDGALVTHTRGGPGHFGHMPVDTSDDAPLCACGARGCAEAFLAAWRATAAPGGAPPAASRSPALLRALTVLCRHVAAVYAPERVELGGGVVDADEALAPAVAAACAAQRGSLWEGGFTVTRAPLPGEQAGVIGAALLADDAAA